MPVRPGPDGDWVVNSAEEGLLGQGRALVQLADPERRGWRLSLPDEFALTSPRPGTAHSAFVEGHRVVLVGGRAGHPGPSAIAGLDPEHGRLSWRRDLMPNSKVFLYEGGRATVLVADCGPGSCRLTGWDAFSGRRSWTRTERGSVQVLDGCRADAFAVERRSDVHRCRPYLVASGRVAVLDPENGRSFWMTGLRLPGGRIDRITQRGDHVTMATAPARGSCRVTVIARRIEKYDGHEKLDWQRTFVWDQPQAPRDPGTGCRWDRTIPLMVGYGMVLPEADGALVVPFYGGTLEHSQRLAPGEYLVTDGTMNQIVRAPGRPDRSLNRSDRPIRPRGLGPAARLVTAGFWQDGRRLSLPGREDHVLWEGTSDCQAFAGEGKGPGVRLTYCDGDDLVTLRPVEED
ncbi:outer membrane protein assembly factor BamB family protein [Streptomyces sp. NBC_00691]|uniref:outer membrane protein assembly factor BamB family protein n=1 Tax=Streptomyces sp. NBC_00691 TaxID=2903671 RepID=UPI002E375EDF|nr:PQQ-binding-like beta-propeller repeat protein [Streptomyces sp. NBC_00691]